MATEKIVVQMENEVDYCVRLGPLEVTRSSRTRLRVGIQTACVQEEQSMQEGTAGIEGAVAEDIASECVPSVPLKVKLHG
jgi:hypothetical protein